MCVGSKSALNSIAPHPKETISLQNNLLKNLEINLEINNHNSLITHDQHQSFVLLWAASVLSRFWSIFHKGRGGVYLYLLFSLELHMKQIKSRFEARSALQVVIHKRAKQFHAFDDIFSACFIPQLCNSRFLNCFFHPLGTAFQTCEIEEASFLVVLLGFKHLGRVVMMIERCKKVEAAGAVPVTIKVHLTTMILVWCFESGFSKNG